MPFKNRIRLPLKVTRPQFSKDKTTYPMANGSIKTLSVVVHKKYEGETDWLPEKWHQRLAIALEHDTVTIEADKYLGGIVTDGDYEIEWPKFLDFPTGKASFSVFVSPFDNSNDNCQTCEQATQLSLEDDSFPDILEEGQTYELNVATNDNICCYPAAFSIVSFDTDYIETASLDQLGNLSVTMKSTFFSGIDIPLVTYRVTCPNGGYDEAIVSGDVEGEEPECAAPSNITFSAITTSSAEVDFTAASPAPDHYSWKLYIVDPSNFEYFIQQGDESTNHIDLTGLSQVSKYKIYIRSQCDNTDNDSPASVYISGVFTTPAASNSCGEYIISYNDPFGGPGAHTDATYQDCNGVSQNVYVPNNVSRVVCARQSSPGVPISINPGAGSYSHGTDSNCNSAPTSIKIFVGRGPTTGTICGNVWPVWIDAAYTDVIPGITVYTDTALTIPLTGFNFIGSLAGTIFNINSGTGVVGSSTGLTC